MVTTIPEGGEAAHVDAYERFIRHHQTPLRSEEPDLQQQISIGINVASCRR